MYPKVSVFIATSLDGFIARPDGDLDWLEAAQSRVPEGEDCGYGEFIKSVDRLVMGRHTYEKVMSFGTWPYHATPVTVLSSRPIDSIDNASGIIDHSAEPPLQLCERLASAGARHLYVDGGNTIQRFLSAGLVDALTITVIPIVLGSGIPLFGPSQADRPLDLLNARAYDFGFVQLKYAVKSTPAN